MGSGDGDTTGASDQVVKEEPMDIRPPAAELASESSSGGGLPHSAWGMIVSLLAGVLAAV